MPLYHFDLVNTKTIADEGGAELPDDIDAIDCADGIARRILDERPFSTDRHYWILVANEDGNEFGPSRRRCTIRSFRFSFPVLVMRGI
jgi:hypothetical protein